jgi:hypothetical protein
MTVALVWMAVALGCLGAALGYFCLRAAKASRRSLDQVQGDLQGARRELEEEKRRHRALVEAPPAPTDAQFVGHLLVLEQRVTECIASLEDWRIRSAQPLQMIAEEAEQARTVSRQERFVAFRDTLLNANIQISGHTERLSAALPLIVAIADSLKSGHLDPAVGRGDTGKIMRVLSDLAHEQWPDDDRRGVLHRQTDEFRARLKADDRMKEIDQRQREQDRAAAAVAFN